MRPVMRWSAGAVLAATLLAVGCAPTMPDKRDELAMADYRMAIDPTPHNHHLRAEARYKRGLLVEALADVDAELASYGLGDKQATIHDPVKALLLRSRINEDRGDTAAALADLDRIREPPPSGSAGGVMTLYDLAARRATLLIRLRRLGEAETAAALLLSLGPTSSEFATGWKLMREVYAAR